MTAIMNKLKKGRTPWLALPQVLAAVLTVAALGGCGPVVPQRDSVSRYPQVHLTNWRYWGKLRVGEPIPSRVGGGQLHIAVPLRNTTNGELLLDYQYRFLDAHGQQIQGTSGWNTVRVPAQGMREIHFTSLSPLADDFDLDIRPAR
jgi:hypothetical protein